MSKQQQKLDAVRDKWLIYAKSGRAWLLVAERGNERAAISRAKQCRSQYRIYFQVQVLYYAGKRDERPRSLTSNVIPEGL